MNQKSKNTSRATQQQASLPFEQELGIEQASDPFGWVEGTIAALGRYLFAGELTAPMTHRPKMVVNGAGSKSILVRYLYEGTHQTVCIGQPLSPEQFEESREFFTEPETNVQKGN
ncbi:hypothetical protein ACFDR9_003066 [Janthinobacterium sp. CG_23.3]|uniref:hypothetical protein n=1 Tax=Janthinobacterium sp. CG_23.3 TaxID=3349634 RepID=UPI0038D48621